MTDAATAVDFAALRRVALDQLHAGWAENIPAALVQRARQSRLGRRLLARSLSKRWAPTLFATPSATLAHSSTALAWSTWPAPSIAVLTLDLGALALAAPIHAVVDRAQVLRLKRVLGEPRYQLALAEPGDGDDDGLRDALARDSDLLRLVRGRGYAELHAFAQRLHPAFAERLRLSVRPGAVPQQWLPRLQPERIERHLTVMTAAEAE